jgi:hypothetical protein
MKRLSTSSTNVSAPKVDAQSVNNAGADAPTDTTESFENQNRNAADDAGRETEAEPDGPVDPNAYLEILRCTTEPFKIDRALGRGGLSITYLSHSVASGQKVVIKEFFPPGAQRAPVRVVPMGTAVYNVLPGGYCTGRKLPGSLRGLLGESSLGIACMASQRGDDL